MTAKSAQLPLASQKYCGKALMSAMAGYIAAFEIVTVADLSRRGSSGISFRQVGDKDEGIRLGRRVVNAIPTMIRS